MAKIRPLTRDQAIASLANRLGGSVVDRVRQLATNFGIRPYRVFLVWTRFGGAERGEGTETEISRIEILPTPLVMSLDGINLNPYTAGVLPMGVVRVSEISIARYTGDVLSGRAIPKLHEDHIPEPYDFFYEIVEDGRGDADPIRMRYRLMSPPTYKMEDVMWTVGLERASEDRSRSGRSQMGTDEEV